MPAMNSHSRENCRATTLVELVVSMAMMVVIMGTVFSVIALAGRTFETQTRALEVMQNGRLLIDALARELTVARQVTAVSAAADTTGYIEFTGNDDAPRRFDINTENGYVQFGPTDNLQDLAGPVSQLQFTCYDPCDLDTPITDVNEIRLITIEAILASSDELSRDKTFKTSVFLFTDGDETLPGFEGHWCLDDDSGTLALDSSGHDRHGTLQNMAGDEWTTGVLDGALKFNGIADYVELPIGTVIEETTDCTVAMWVKWSTLGDPWQPMFDFGSGTTCDMYLCSNNTEGNVHFGITVGGWYNEEEIDTSTSVAGDWHHLAVTIDDANATHRVYLDGQVIGQNTSASLTPSDLGETTQSWLGRSQYSTEPYFDGILDDVRFYSRALSTQEISDLVDNAPLVQFRGFEDAVAQPAASSLTIPTPSNEDVGTATVSLLGGATGTSYIVPPGSNRLLVFTAHAVCENLGVTLDGVTYGGQAMTRVQEEIVDKNDDTAYVVAYMLNESGIAGASGTTFSLDWSDDDDIEEEAYYCLAVENVNQSVPVGDAASKEHDKDKTLATESLSTCEGDLVILAAAAVNMGAYTVNHGFAEAQELAMDPGDGVVGYVSADGDDVTPEVYHNSPKGQAIIGFVIQAGAGDPITTIQGDLLIAVLSIDEYETIGAENETLEAPSEEGWTLLSQGTGADKVTVGVWAKLASASESPVHTFTWGSDEEGYGWIMRFTGFNPGCPLDDMEVTSGGKTEFPPSPSVTTLVNNTMILRIGGFDGDKITVDDTGLEGHTTITMNKGGGRGGAAGGAAYKHQLEIGSSGSDRFELTDDKEYRTITLAIAPDTSP